MAEKQQKPKRENRDNLAFIYITQQLKPEFWDWADADSAERQERDGKTVDNRLGLTRQQAIDLIETGTAEEITAYVVRRLEYAGDLFLYDTPEEEMTDKQREQNTMHTGCGIVAAYGIIHDKDEVEVWDENAQAKVKVPKARHTHILISFKVEKKKGRNVPKSGTLAYLAKRIGVPDNQLDKPNRGGNPVDISGLGKVSQSFDNQLAYLIHIKYPEKYQYPPEEVAGIRGPDYIQIYRERYSDWLTGRAHVKKKRAAESIEDLREKILTGEVTKNQILLTDDLYTVYGRHQRTCDDAFKVYAERQAALKTADMNESLGTVWRKSTVTVMGRAGSGKGVFGDHLTAQLQEIVAQAGAHWSRADLAGRNALEELGTAEIAYHDDARWYMLPAYDEFLRYFDAHRSTAVAARFSNKAAPTARVIVLNSSETLFSFGMTTKARKSSDDLIDGERRGRPANIDEFLRRVGWHVEVELPPGTPDDDLPTVTAEAVMSIYRIHKTDALRTEPVHDRDENLLGNIRTQRRLELVGVIKGIPRAARFLAVEVIEERNSDIAELLPDDIRGELVLEHFGITEELRQHEISKAIDAAEAAVIEQHQADLDELHRQAEADQHEVGRLAHLHVQRVGAAAQPAVQVLAKSYTPGPWDPAN